MGIKNLKKFIRDKFPNEIQKSNLSHFYGQIITMDVMYFIYKFKITSGNKWLQSFINLIRLFKKYNIHVNVVLEGESPVEKNKEKENRKKQRQQQEQKLFNIKKDLDEYYRTNTISNELKELCKKLDKNDNEKVDKLLHFNNKIKETNESNSDVDFFELDNRLIQLINDFIDKKENQMVNVSREDLNKVNDLCNSFGVPCLQSENEAETLCCKLSRNVKNKKDNSDLEKNNCNLKSIGVISEDTDVLAYGCEMFICDLNIVNGDCNVIYLPSLLETMELEYQQFLEFCILSGTDYNSNIPGIGSVKCYDWILKHKSINCIFDIEKKTIQKKIDDCIKKKKSKMNDNNDISSNDNNEENEDTFDLQILDIDILKKDMIHSINMFDTENENTITSFQTRYWNCNLNIDTIAETYLKYNIHSGYNLEGNNSILNLWNNKIKLK
jgi:flap endonuclease-1